MRTAVKSERTSLGDQAVLLGSAAQAARVLQAGEVSAQGLLATLLARIERVNPTLNAIVTLDAEQARARAQAADEALARGERWGPLHGVPITVKDAFETAGMRTVSGYPPLRANVPGQDAPAVARLRDAGAIIVGKTNLPTLASGIQSTNPVFGRTNNPWDLTRTPGGRSGGSAAAVAAGLSFLDLGSDIGGSIRIPAHFCGVYGLKLTGGRIPGKRYIASPRPLTVPAGWEALLQLGAFGPLARSVDDLCLGYTVLTGVGPALPRATARLRGAWTTDFGGAPLSAESAALIRQLVQALRQRAARLRSAHREGWASTRRGTAWGRASGPSIRSSRRPSPAGSAGSGRPRSCGLGRATR